MLSGSVSTRSLSVASSDPDGRQRALDGDLHHLAVTNVRKCPPGGSDLADVADAPTRRKTGILRVFGGQLRGAI